MATKNNNHRAKTLFSAQGVDKLIVPDSVPLTRFSVEKNV